MANQIPNALMDAATRTLPREVLDAVTAAPENLLPDKVWHGLDGDQRAMVRRLRDGFDVLVAFSAAPADGAGATHLVGADPLTAAPGGINAKTGNEPESMKALFGDVIDTKGLAGFEGQALLDEVRRRFFANHFALDYHQARELMFSQIDNAQGSVADVYAGRTVAGVHGVPDAGGTQNMNTEHTWPQSQLKAAGKDVAVSDLHHLFPVDTVANGKRANDPFGVVVQVQWQVGESKLGLDAKGQLVFEPPPGHRGDVARAMFWIAAAYQLHIPPDEEAVLRSWADSDPVSATERTRNERVEQVQGDLNPFVLEPDLAKKVKDF